MSNTFQWTPELWCEFLNGLPVMPPSFAANAEQFKVSKEPKKEWEIVAFKQHDKIYKLVENWKEANYSYPVFAHSDDYYFGLVYANDPKYGCTIHSVRRLSDGQIFSVGDKASTPAIQSGRIIKSFQIIGGGMAADFDDGRAGINLLQKPTALFTTLDGVEINTENPNRIYPVDKDFGYVVTTLTEYNKDAWGNHKVFSTREAAETYIVNNKPCLSVEDVKEILERSGATNLLSKLSGLVKSKLNP